MPKTKNFRHLDRPQKKKKYEKTKEQQILVVLNNFYNFWEHIRSSFNSERMKGIFSFNFSSESTLSFRIQTRISLKLNRFSY